MVVLTILLAKAAYDRYNNNSPNKTSEEEEQAETAIRSEGAIPITRVSSSTTSVHWYDKNEYTLRESSSSLSFSANKASRVLTRKPSFQREIGTNRTKSTTASSSSTTGRRTRTTNKSAGAANNKTSSTRTKSAKGKSASKKRSNNYKQKSCAASKIMSSNNAKPNVTVPTSRGHFHIDPKAKIMMLPPEGSRHPTVTKTTSVLSQCSNNGQNDGQNILNDLQALGSKSNQDGETVEFPLSSTEMTMAMMGEVMESSSQPLGTNNDTKVTNVSTANNITTGNNNNTTFRNDVRNEWVDAVFGKDFFPIHGEKREVDIRPQQGIGAAGIPHCVTYGAVLDAGPSLKQQNAAQNASGNAKHDTPNKPSIQSKTQSTPLIFSSPSSLSLNGTFLSSSSFSPSACGGGGVMDSNPFETPGGTGRQVMNGAKYTVEGTPGLPKTATSNNATNAAQPKLGITISRIPLGLYVHSLSLDSEAYAVGISPGSILVDINGMGMLGERSDRALERLWWYAGVFSKLPNANTTSGDGNGTSTTRSAHDKESSKNKNTVTSPDSPNHANLQFKKPLLLRLYKSGRIYTALLLSGKPLAGIRWAPCGNFALVHKVASNSLAAECGVRRGTLVVGVNDVGLRSLDHGGVAGCLRELFLRGVPITLSMGYTPAASRSGFHERDHHQSSSSNPMLDGSLSTSINGGNGGEGFRSSNNSTNSIRDVEVRSRPVEYSSAVVETFFACTGPGAMAMVDDSGGGAMMGGSQSSVSSGLLRGDRSNNYAASASGMVEVAAYVAAGGILSPGRGILEAASEIISKPSRRLMLDPARIDGSNSKNNLAKSFTPCPTLAPDVLLSEWNSLSSLSRSMAYQSAGSYCETTYTKYGGPFERITDCGAEGEAPYSAVECMDVIRGIANGDSNVEQDDVALPSVRGAVMAGGAADTIVAAEKVFDAHLLQLLGVAMSPMMGAAEKGQRLSEILMDIVIDVALNDINLCQRLFFLLRSFIGEIEEQKVPNGYISEKSSLAMPLAMRLCRYAQRRLSGRMFDKSARKEKERHCSEGYPINRESTCSTSRMQQGQSQQDYSQLRIAASQSSIGGNGKANGNTTAKTESSGDDGENYPSQEPNVFSPPSSMDGAEGGGAVPEQQQQQPTSLMMESSLEDILASVSGSSREKYDQNSTLEQNDSTKKKSKSKKNLLRILKGRSFKKPSSFDHGGSTFTPSVSVDESKKSKSFSFPNVFHKQQQQTPVLQTIDCVPPPTDSTSDGTISSESISLSRKFENMAWILRQLDNSCSTIEKNLTKTFSQKMADWALYSPWSAGKESALASVTQSFRSELRLMNPSSNSSDTALSELTETMRFPILNPVDPSELLTSVDADECFILPSAHFPLLLCFNSEQHVGSPKAAAATAALPRQRSRHQDGGGGGSGDTLYRTRVEILGLRSALPPTGKEAFVIQGTVAGVIQESGVSDASRRSKDSASYRWTSNSTLVFETQSNWGFPKALSLKVSSMSKYTDGPDEESHDQSEVGCGFVDLCPIWEQVMHNQGSKQAGSSMESKTKIHLFDSAEEFDQHGQAVESFATREEGLELHLRVSVEVVSYEQQPKKRLLLYKHGDDLRQELLAIQFIERCNQILLASGLDLKLKTFSCQPVGSKTGFIEWVRGTVPLSELCKSSGSSHPGSNVGVDSRQSSRSKEGLTEGETTGYATTAPEEVLGHQSEILPTQSHRWFKYQSLPGLRQKSNNGSVFENPIQDFLRSAAYDESAPYLVKKDVMATYVKSCAGYCVITYLLGVGDRHLDNILLHHNGHLLHCDYSFILGQDPKTYLPMRITEEMIKGFGGRDSDNFAKFLFFTGAAFLTLRRHNNLHSLLSHICNMVHANMGDVSINQPPEEAILAMRGRFRLDLNDDDALAYIEDVVEKSISSKMWKAVDWMHTWSSSLQV
mmetsp:Transcript_8501/g.19026  ORF Transcript_8501/g.19026 Transcript_8501/m.19026 type:complete len:1924 (+) Transcript_8501:286-6057(+)